MSWQRLRGHDAVVQAFDRVVRSGRLAHAYLFVGPPGIGKRLFALELAKALLCENPSKTRLEACDRCAGCHLVDAGTHPDLHSACKPEDRLEMPIKLIQELCGSFALKPGRGRGRVAVIDDVDDFNEESANCFLKTLEEPPPHSLLLLIGTSVDRQLPTLVSRCQIVRFAPLSEALVAELLREQGVDKPALIQRIARLSHGSPGQARELADPVLWDFRRALLDGLAQPRIDSVRLAQSWVHFVEEAGKEAALQRRRASLVLSLLIEFLSDVLTLRVGGTPRLGEPEDLRRAQEMANQADPETIIELLERCLQSDVQIDRRAQTVLILEALMDAFGKLSTIRKPASLARR